ATMHGGVACGDVRNGLRFGVHAPKSTDPRQLRSIRPTRARRPSDASVDPTEARKDDGHALAMGGTELERYAPADRELKRLESEARAARRGLWSHLNPVPPWEWHNGEGVPQTEKLSATGGAGSTTGPPAGVRPT